MDANKTYNFLFKSLLDLIQMFKLSLHPKVLL